MQSSGSYNIFDHARHQWGKQSQFRESLQVSLYKKQCSCIFFLLTGLIFANLSVSVHDHFNIIRIIWFILINANHWMWNWHITKNFSMCTVDCMNGSNMRFDWSNNLLKRIWVFPFSLKARLRNVMSYLINFILKKNHVYIKFHSPDLIIDWISIKLPWTL